MREGNWEFLWILIQCDHLNGMNRKQSLFLTPSHAYLPKVASGGMRKWVLFPWDVGKTLCLGEGVVGLLRGYLLAQRIMSFAGLTTIFQPKSRVAYHHPGTVPKDLAFLSPPQLPLVPWLWGLAGTAPPAVHWECSPPHTHCGDFLEKLSSHSLSSFSMSTPCQRQAWPPRAEPQTSSAWLHELCFNWVGCPVFVLTGGSPS